MAKKIIRTGTTADPTGDSLKNAFVKVNDNFTELYNALGLDADLLNLGAFEFTGSVMTTTDSSAIVIDQATTITSNLSVGGDILPSVNLGGTLGSPTQQWKSLYVSTNTIYINNVPLSLDNSNNILVNNTPISSSIQYASIPNAPTDLADLTDLTGLLVAGVTSYNDLTNKPTLFSGSYSDLTNKPDLASTYQFSVAADDSTQRLISTDEVVKFIGAGGITTASDAEGNITITFDGNLRVNNGILYNNLNQDIWIDPSNSQEHSGYIRIPGPPNLNSNPIIVENYLNGGVEIRSNQQVWTFSPVGALTIPGDIRSEGNINIDINLSDSTLRRWQFGEDGALTFPDGTSQSTAYQTSIVRAQRASGGISTTPDKWTFTTVTGSVTAEWVVDGSAAYPALGLASSPYIIFTFTGFTHLPSTLYRNGIVGSGTGLTLVNLVVETVTNTNSPNVLTAFNPTLHKYAFVEGSSLVEDRYYEFRI